MIVRVLFALVFLLIGLWLGGNDAPSAGNVEAPKATCAGDVSEGWIKREN